MTAQEVHAEVLAAVAVRESEANEQTGTWIQDDVRRYTFPLAQHKASLALVRLVIQEHAPMNVAAASWCSSRSCAYYLMTDHVDPGLWPCDHYRAAAAVVGVEVGGGAETCHCGLPVIYGYDGDWSHHRGMCRRCDAVRCDAYPGACGINTATTLPGSTGGTGEDEG